MRIVRKVVRNHGSGYLGGETECLRKRRGDNDETGRVKLAGEWKSRVKMVRMKTGADTVEISVVIPQEQAIVL